MSWYTSWRRSRLEHRINHYTRRIAYITRELDRIQVPFSLEEQFLSHERSVCYFKRQDLQRKLRNV